MKKKLALAKFMIPGRCCEIPCPDVKKALNPQFRPVFSQISKNSARTARTPLQQAAVDPGVVAEPLLEVVEHRPTAAGVVSRAP
jgi:hypothetical protein